jgi:hypothetical protein
LGAGAGAAAGSANEGANEGANTNAGAAAACAGAGAAGAGRGRGQVVRRGAVHWARRRRRGGGGVVGAHGATGQQASGRENKRQAHAREFALHRHAGGHDICPPATTQARKASAHNASVRWCPLRRRKHGVAGPALHCGVPPSRQRRMLLLRGVAATPRSARTHTLTRTPPLKQLAGSSTAVERRKQGVPRF